MRSYFILEVIFLLLHFLGETTPTFNNLSIVYILKVPFSAVCSLYRVCDFDFLNCILFPADVNGAPCDLEFLLSVAFCLSVYNPPLYDEESSELSSYERSTLNPELIGKCDFYVRSS